jgi:hypothetical protein
MRGKKEMRRAKKFGHFSECWRTLEFMKDWEERKAILGCKTTRSRKVQMSHQDAT